MTDQQRPEQLDSRIPASIHPDRVPALANQAAAKTLQEQGVDPNQVANGDDDTVFEEINRGAQALARGLNDLFRRFDTVDQDQTIAGGEKRRMKARLRDKHVTKPAERADKAVQEAQAKIADIDRELNEAVRSHLDFAEAREIRDYIKAQDDPHGFLVKAAKAGDGVTVAAALAQQPYLSGLSADQQAKLRQHFLATNFPDKLARREKLNAAVSQLKANSSRFVELQAGMADAHEAERLERQQQATKDALEQPLAE